MRKDLRRAFAQDGLISALAIWPDEILDTISLNSEVLSMISDARAGDDTFGKATAMIAFILSNADLTEQDRLVVGQILGVAASDIMNKTIVTKNRLDSEDVLTNVTVFQDIKSAFTASDSVTHFVGDAVMEECERIIPYIEQYDRSVKDKSKQWYKSGNVNDSEQAVDEGMWSWVPGVGK